jgi:hypothetical protein
MYSLMKARNLKKIEAGGDGMRYVEDKRLSLKEKGVAELGRSTHQC